MKKEREKKEKIHGLKPPLKHSGQEGRLKKSLEAAYVSLKENKNNTMIGNSNLSINKFYHFACF